MNRNDATFLKSVDNDRNKTSYVRIAILDKHEKPVESIEGRVQDGSSISMNGTSSMRRTCTLNLIADAVENDLTNIDNFLSINRKVKIETGVKYNIDYNKDVIYYNDNSFLNNDGEVYKIYVDRSNLTYYYWDGNSYIQLDSMFDYDDVVIWFPQGIYVITQPNISHGINSVNISLNLKDKMCLLNGELGGGLPTSVTFHEYYQTIGKVECSKDPRSDKDLTPNEYTIYEYNGKYYKWDKQYGYEETTGNEIGDVINVPQLFYDIIQTVVIRFGNESPSRVIINDVPKEIKQIVRWVGKSPLFFNAATGDYTTDENMLAQEGAWRTFLFNEDVGYVYTDFTYPGELITNIGDTVCGILDKIIASLGNYEYFYDIDGNFVFQEKRNYLNTSYLPIEVANNAQVFYLDNVGKKANGEDIILDNNSLCILGKDNYQADFYGDQKSTYNFEEGNQLVNSYSNTPLYTSIKNDYHIWGKNNDGYVIHYHLVIKEPPKPSELVDGELKFPEHKVVFLESDDGKFNGQIRRPLSQEEGVPYRPNDWRAELYLQGLDIQGAGGRPDIYQQELLDLFDSIYEWCYYDSQENFIKEGRFKADITQRPNELQYFMDYLEPTNNLYSVAVDEIGTKMFSYQQDKIIRLYDNEIPDYILIDTTMDPEYQRKVVMAKCDDEGQPHSVVYHNIYTNLAIGTRGYSAQEIVRDYLYQYTNYNETIGIQCIPIQYLDVNRRITVKDKVSGINGDYIITSITMPLGTGSLMTINAIRALNRIPQNYYETEINPASILDGVLYIDSNEFRLANDKLYDDYGDISKIDNQIDDKNLVFVTD